MNSGFNATANVRPTTHAEVLLAIVAKIQLNVSVFTDGTVCFVSDTPLPSPDIQDELFCTVSPGEGHYDLGLIDGFGNLAVAENSNVVVSVFSRMQQDQLERCITTLTDSERGLLIIKQQILAALAGKNLDGGEYLGNPCNLLMEALTPTRVRHVPRDSLDAFAYFSLYFDAKFNWNLGTDSQVI